MLVEPRPDKTTTIFETSPSLILTLPVHCNRKEIVNCISNLLLFLCSCQWCATNDKESLTSHYQSRGNPAEQTWRSSKEYRRTIPANVPHSLTLSAQILRPPYQCLRLTLTGTLGCSSKRLFWPLVSVSGYMVRLGEWSPQKKFQRYRPINDPLPATWSFQW